MSQTNLCPSEQCRNKLLADSASYIYIVNVIIVYIGTHSLLFFSASHKNKSDRYVSFLQYFCGFEHLINAFVFHIIPGEYTQERITNK